MLTFKPLRNIIFLFAALTSVNIFANTDILSTGRGGFKTFLKYEDFSCDVQETYDSDYQGTGSRTHISLTLNAPDGEYGDNSNIFLKEYLDWFEMRANFPIRNYISPKLDLVYGAIYAPITQLFLPVGEVKAGKKICRSVNNALKKLALKNNGFIPLDIHVFNICDDKYNSATQILTARLSKKIPHFNVLTTEHWFLNSPSNNPFSCKEIFKNIKHYKDEDRLPRWYH